MWNVQKVKSFQNITIFLIEIAQPQFFAIFFSLNYLRLTNVMGMNVGRALADTRCEPVGEALVWVMDIRLTELRGMRAEREDRDGGVYLDRRKMGMKANTLTDWY
jgi:hypothetical protein